MKSDPTVRPPCCIQSLMSMGVAGLSGSQSQQQAGSKATADCLKFTLQAVLQCGSAAGQLFQLTFHRTTGSGSRNDTSLPPTPGLGLQVSPSASGSGPSYAHCLLSIGTALLLALLPAWTMAPGWWCQWQWWCVCLLACPEMPDRPQLGWQRCSSPGAVKA